VGTPRTEHHPNPDPTIDRANAVKLAGRAATKADRAVSERDAAIRFAATQGASLRELAEATGVSHMSVKRIIERTPAEAV
jgi:DNA invertase Pin-like site-specific DNA recombinase